MLNMCKGFNSSDIHISNDSLFKNQHGVFLFAESSIIDFMPKFKIGIVESWSISYHRSAIGHLLNSSSGVLWVTRRQFQE